MITRRSLFLGSAAVILTPELLMPVRPDRLILVPFHAQHITDGTLVLEPPDIPSHVAYGMPKGVFKIDGYGQFNGVWVNPLRGRMERLEWSEPRWREHETVYS